MEMVPANIFFWVVPIIFSVLIAAFTVIARTHSQHASAPVAARAFCFALLAILLDTQRSGYVHALFILAVPLHWLTIHQLLTAMLLRHDARMPRAACVVLVVGSVIVLASAFVEPAAAVARLIASHAVGAILLGLGARRLVAYRQNVFDRAIARVVVVSWLGYCLLVAAIFVGDMAAEYIRDPVNAPYMVLFYFTTGIMVLTSAMLLLLAVTVDVIENHHRTATLDALTGLGNRHALDQVAAAHAGGSAPIGGVVMIDLDHFKAINDLHGHAVGDAVLQATALSLGRCARQFAEIIRLGGEEMALLVRATHADALPQLAHVLRQAVELQHLDAPTALPRVTASIGVARAMPHESLSELMRRADIALYAAKSAGRNRVCFADGAAVATPASDMALSRATR